MAAAYKDADREKQPGVLVYPGFLDLRLHDMLYEESIEYTSKDIPVEEKILSILEIGPKGIKELQAVTSYKSRSVFLKEVINPLIENGKIYRDGKPKSPKGLFYKKE